MKLKGYCYFSFFLILIFACSCSNATGKFLLSIEKPINSDYSNLVSYLNENLMLKKVVDALNKDWIIPYNIKIVTKEADEGCYYDQTNKTVVLSYDFMMMVLDIYEKSYPNESAENTKNFLNHLILWNLYHELGHAFIDAYNFPIIGAASNEDMADAVASLSLLTYFGHGIDALLDTSNFYKLLSQYRNVQFGDHQPDSNRYHEMVCSAYGNSPAKVMKIVKDSHSQELEYFIKIQDKHCLEQYSIDHDAYMRFIEPHLTEHGKSERIDII